MTIVVEEFSQHDRICVIEQTSRGIFIDPASVAPVEMEKDGNLDEILRFLRDHPKTTSMISVSMMFLRSVIITDDD